MKLLWVIKTPASQWKSANYNFKFSPFSAPFSVFFLCPQNTAAVIFSPPFLYPKWKRQLWKCIVLHGTQNHSYETRTMKLKNANLCPLQSQPKSCLGPLDSSETHSSPRPTGHRAIFKMKTFFVLRWGLVEKQLHPSPKVNTPVAKAKRRLHHQHLRMKHQQWSWNSKVKQALQSSMNVGGSHQDMMSSFRF